MSERIHQELPSTEPDGVYAYGAWSALLTAILTILFVAATLTLSPRNWQGFASYAAEYRQTEILLWIPCCLFALTYAVTLVSLFY